MARVTGFEPIPVVTAPVAEQVARDGGTFAQVEPGTIRLPRLRGLAGELAGYDGEQELYEGLGIILAGVRTSFLPWAPDEGPAPASADQ